MKLLFTSLFILSITLIRGLPAPYNMAPVSPISRGLSSFGDKLYEKAKQHELKGNEKASNIYLNSALRSYALAGVTHEFRYSMKGFFERIGHGYKQGDGHFFKRLKSIPKAFSREGEIIVPDASQLLDEWEIDTIARYWQYACKQHPYPLTTHTRRYVRHGRLDKESI